LDEFRQPINFGLIKDKSKTPGIGAASSYLRFVEPFLRDQDVGKTPPHLRIAARKRRQE